MFVIASLDEMFITALLDRQAEAVVAEAYPSVFIHRLTLEGGLTFFAPELVQMSAYN